MQNFLKGKVSGDITDIPGIGPAAAKKLAEGEDENDQITNTFQFIGKVRIAVFSRCYRL